MPRKKGTGVFKKKMLCEQCQLVYVQKGICVGCEWYNRAMENANTESKKKISSGPVAQKKKSAWITVKESRKIPYEFKTTYANN